MKPTFLNRLGYNKDNLVSWGGVLSLVILWCLVTYSRWVPKVFLPTPTGIWEGIMDYYHKGWLLAALGRSFRRVSLALAFVVGIGATVGIVMGAFPYVDAFFRKLVNAGKSIPITGIAGLIVLWFGIDERGKTVYLFLGGLFYMILLTRNAVASVSEDYIAVANDLGASRSQRLWRVLVPGALPQIWEAIAVCNGIMWTYIILAEFIGAEQSTMGLGYLLFTGSRANDSGKVFGMLAFIALISVFTDFVLRLIRNQVRYLNWASDKHG